MAYLDEGLATLRAELKRRWPDITIYWIGDENHDVDPDVSQHAPDDGGSQPGDDRGEVDAIDAMPTGGATMDDLRNIFDELRASRDPRILYMIIDKKIVSSVTVPWVVREYSGTKHSHLHISVNDRYDANTADWKWEPEMPREYTMRPIPGEFPELRIGDEDLAGQIQYVKRIQSILLGMYGQHEIEVDGVYGAKTAAGVKHLMLTDPARSSTNGSKFYVPEAKRLFAIW